MGSQSCLACWAGTQPLPRLVLGVWPQMGTPSWVLGVQRPLLDERMLPLPAPQFPLPPRAPQPHYHNQPLSPHWPPSGPVSPKQPLQVPLAPKTLTNPKGLRDPHSWGLEQPNLLLGFPTRSAEHWSHWGARGLGGSGTFWLVSDQELGGLWNLLAGE